MTATTSKPLDLASFAGFTPGEWDSGNFRTNDGQRAVMAGKDYDRKRVALVDCQTERKRGKGYDVECKERDANTALIAAAPALLQLAREQAATIKRLRAALEAMHEAGVYHFKESGWPSQFHAGALSKARAALEASK